MIYFDDTLKPVAVERYGLALNEWGDWVEDWSTHVTVFAYIRNLTGNEQTTSNKTTAVSTHRMYTDIADIKVEDRVKDNGNIYDIIFVNQVHDSHLQVELELVK